MKTEELIELSKRVADKLGVPPYDFALEGGFIAKDGERYTWLHEDSARCFELMCERNISVSFGSYMVEANLPWGTFAYQYDLFNGDKALATRVAILRAIEGM